ncbi:RNase H-like domain found in reverse transcriptase [Popillia japonica]|uniref:RNA-directed DNA polymerase n=1 Tax=Popillia japonica TaxID=7064 RepID=A0AAW1JC02_POPJA
MLFPLRKYRLFRLPDFSQSTNQRDGVRQFLGLTDFFRRFIKDYAKISKPLPKLLSKSGEWIWGNEQEAAFEKLKQELAGDNVLILYSHEAHTELHTDASQLGLGAARSSYRTSYRCFSAWIRCCTFRETT